MAITDPTSTRVATKPITRFLKGMNSLREIVGVPLGRHPVLFPDVQMGPRALRRELVGFDRFHVPIQKQSVGAVTGMPKGVHVPGLIQNGDDIAGAVVHSERRPPETG